IHTDGIDVCVLKQNQVTSKDGTRSVGADPLLRMTAITPTYINKNKRTLEGNWQMYIIDPSRRDMLYCMHEK
ncbi:hypothetical protein BCV72DRAFT_186601, partial [Rhizopus microsporus var. microsporus]